MVSRAALAASMKILLERGFRFTIIGGTVVELAAGKSDLGDDVDLFAESPSPVFEETAFSQLAEEMNWTYGQTWLGTPRIVARVAGEEVPIEFYDNIYDFYVPESIIEEGSRIDIGGIRLKIISLEDHILLKANAARGPDMDRLAEIAKMVKKGKLTVDKRRLEDRASVFDEPLVIIRRLREVSLL